MYEIEPFRVGTGVRKPSRNESSDRLGNMENVLWAKLQRPVRPVKSGKKRKMCGKWKSFKNCWKDPNYYYHASL